MLGVPKSWCLLFMIVEQAWNYCQVAGTAQGLTVQCSSSPTLNPVPRRESSPVSHSYITWQLIHTASHCIIANTGREFHSPNSFRQLCSRKVLSSLFCRCAETWGSTARGPCMGRCSSARTMTAACPGHSCQHVLSQLCQGLSFSHPTPPGPCPCGWTSWLWPASKAPSLDNEIQHTAKRLCDTCGRYNLPQSLSAPMCRHSHLKCCLLLLCSS